MYVCMYVGMYVCMQVCMYAGMYVCMYVCMHVGMYRCRYDMRFVASRSSMVQACLSPMVRISSVRLDPKNDDFYKTENSGKPQRRARCCRSQNTTTTMASLWQRCFVEATAQYKKPWPPKKIM